MMDRLTICDEICRRVHVSRENPLRTSLSKRELIAVWRHLIRTEARLGQLETELRVRSQEGSGV
jgi:hypothetical protein